MIVLTILTVFLVCLAYLIVFIKRKHNHWRSQAIAGPPPTFLLGNLPAVARQNPFQLERSWHEQYGPIYGTYAGLRPVLTILEPELIKQVLVSDFGCFVNRKQLNVYHSITNHNLFNSIGEQWKRIRSLVTPTFSSGKLKRMSPTMVDNVRRLLDNLKHAPGGRINAKQTFCGLTINVIASTVFGVQTNASSGQGNAFIKHGTHFHSLNRWKVLVAQSMPRWLNSLLGIKYIFNKEDMDFFLAMIKQVLDNRKRQENYHQKRDLIQLLLNASIDEQEWRQHGYEALEATMDDKEHQQGNLYELRIPVFHFGFVSETISQAANQTKLTRNEVIAQAILFFVAGFETTSSTLAHCAFELAQSQPVQQRLRDELVAKLGDMNSESDAYLETVMNHCPYLDACIKETLRKYPPLNRLERRVNVDGYQLGPVRLPRNQLVEISNLALHYDPQYFPNPHCFQPDRFMPENKDNFVPYTYMPFGLGPRNCVGIRFAYQELKLCLALLLTRFKLSPIAGLTPERVQFKPGGMVLTSVEFALKVESI